MPQTTILTMLQTEHRQMAQLFKELELTSARGPGRRKEIIAEIDDALSTHVDFEERKVYPLMNGNDTAKLIALEAQEEHQEIRRLLSELRDLDPQDERWMAKAHVLMEDVAHHVEEEEDEAFPQLRKEPGTKILQRLGQEYKALKGETQRQNPTAGRAERTGSPNTTAQVGKRRRNQDKGRNSKEADKVPNVVDSLQDGDA